jgi:methane/ammonia monooxygenase subunit C
MAQAVQAPSEPTATTRRRHGPIDWWGGWRVVFVGPIVFIVLALAIRIWQQWTAWGPGLEAASQDFTYTFRVLFYGSVLATAIASIGWWGWLVQRGRQVVSVAVSRDEEVRRIAKFWGLIATVSVVLYIEASFWPNQDGAWHQTVVRDTALTPSHIPMFFMFFPLGITVTVGTYLYGRYWLPKVYGAEKGFPWSFLFLIAAAVTEMMQVAMNEWGHSVWITEEIFAVPFHWPFVMYGWLASGIFALWAETLIRLLQIEDEAVAAGAADEAAA